MYARTKIAQYFERFEGMEMAKLDRNAEKTVKLPKQERMPEVATEEPEGSEEVERFKRNIASAIDRLFENGTFRTQKQIAFSIGIEEETLVRWKSKGIKRTRSGKIIDFCENNGIVPESMWEESLRFMEPVSRPSVATGISTLDQKYEALKSTGSWPIIAALLEKLYEAERK